MRARLLVPLAFLVVVAPACRKKPVDQLPDVRWNGDTATLEWPKFYAYGGFEIRGLRYVVSFSGLPDGTRLSLGGSEQTAHDKEDAVVELDLGGRVGEMPPAEAFERISPLDPNAALALTYPGGITQTIPLPPRRIDVEEALEQVADRPIRFGAEGDAAPARHSIAQCLHEGRPKGTGAEVLGPATVMRDVDLVAIAPRLPTRTGKTCTFDPAGDGGKSLEGVLKIVAQEVRIYERKTGKLVAKKGFAGGEDCPMVAWVKRGEIERTPDWDAMRAWLVEQQGSL